VRELRLSNVTKRFGSLVAVDGISFTLEEQGTYSLVGPNGAGKTTLFNLLKGTQGPDEGSITFGGRSLNGLSPAETTQIGIARAFQQARVFPALSILDNVMIGYHTVRETGAVQSLVPISSRNAERKQLREQALELLSFIGIDSDPSVPVSSLPYAHRKLCSVAMALATEPELLLLDEPVAGMNSEERQEMLATIERIQDAFDVTVLLIEHDMEFVVDLSDRIIVLNEGTKIAEGEPENVMTDDAVVRAYLGENVGGLDA
jgi:branched-chain amino acid transport system ATP-binding protein